MCACVLQVVILAKPLATNGGGALALVDGRPGWVALLAAVASAMPIPQPQCFAQNRLGIMLVGGRVAGACGQQVDDDHH